jgi:hemerythrin-like domain-containing protein
MGVLDVFHKQHAQILTVVREIGDLLDQGARPDGPARHRALLSTLSGTLSVHLAMEDGSLYPRLAQDKSPEVRAIAVKYETEMRGLARAFREHLGRWASATAIRENPVEFAADTKRIVEALTNRISFEDAELYPALERLGD